MEFLKIGAIIISILSCVLLLAFAVTKKGGFKGLLLNAFISLAVLFILNLTEGFTGVGLPINLYTVLGSSVFGIPAVCMFLVLKFIFV